MPPGIPSYTLTHLTHTHPLIDPHAHPRPLTHPHAPSRTLTPPHSQDSLWKERAKPVVLRLQDMSLPDAASLAEVERRAWSLEENAAVLLAAIDHLVYTRGMRVACVCHAHGHGGMPACRYACMRMHVCVCM